MHQTIPLIYFPTKVMVIDDDPIFLMGLTYILPKEYLLTYTNIQEGLDYLDLNSIKYENVDSYLMEASFVNDDFEPLDVIHNIETIFKKLCNPTANDVSVILIDYNLHETNGLEICKKINDIPIKKILMTGGMEQGLALKAFNDGYIDFYISKNEQNLKMEIISAINKLKITFFQDYNKRIGIIRDIDDSAEYSKIFNLFLTEKNIVSYYAIDTFGSYQCFNFEGKPYQFMCWSDEQLNELLMIGENCQANSNIIEKLKNKEYGVFLSTEADKLKSVCFWEEHMYPIKGNILTKNGLYHYSYI